jgi:pimeloyl-ACP methyl ester carboxylesterase
MNERAFLAQLESANVDELSELLRRPSLEEERMLEIYFGADRLSRLRRLALGAQRRGKPRGNVIVLHGIMGGELTVYPQNQADQYIWLNIPRLAIGAVGWMRMTPEPKSQYDVRSTGILKKWYSEMLLGLAADQWNVKAFWYDWRLDLADSADALYKQINQWFGSESPVHLVAHSMGGLVSRTFILRYPDRWAKGGKLVMLGTPNHGSFTIPQVITGALDTVRKIAILDVTHNRGELLNILNTFPGSVQMLPSPLVLPEMEKMYDQNTWQRFGLGGKLLDIARSSHARLAKVVDGDRMVYIGGYNQPTKNGVADWNRLDEPDGYSDTLDGDGTVPHTLGFLKSGTTRIPTFFVECEHGALANHPDVISGTQQILANGKCSLPSQPVRARGSEDLASRIHVKQELERHEEEKLRELSRRVRARTRSTGSIANASLSAEEIAASEMVVRNFLSGAFARPVLVPSGTLGEGPLGRKQQRVPVPPLKPVSITIKLIRGGIETVNGQNREVDAISVGHYVGVAPQYAELALDREISRALKPANAANAVPSSQSKNDLLITALHRRGIIVGELAQNFLLPDPRDPKRMIVIAGMGRPGTFREAELAVLVRELTWTLGRCHRKHLCTVLIGAGAGNLETPDAVRSWLRGVRRALYEAETDDPSLGTKRQVKSITFVEESPVNFLRLHRALKSAVVTFAKDPEAPMQINYLEPGIGDEQEAEKAAKDEASEKGIREMHRLLKAGAGNGSSPEPVRLTIRLLDNTFEFAALTAEASVPQRETKVEAALVDEANNLLPAAVTFDNQIRHGHILGCLLVPADLREKIIRPGVPIVLALDAATARIHWEMVTLDAAETNETFDSERFFGTNYGLTRQLRTNFAPLPEPPILTSRALRVLVVADPAEEEALPGAQEEGEAVASIFEEFGRETGRTVEVVRLFGPGEATRVAVLDHLINHRFDVLHYSGHCDFNQDDPQDSGWLFSKNKKLNAHALRRVDRIPRFVFSNACESGITPDRADKRNALLGPSFAEAFFERGVANFICTAWPVNDAAALEFARRLYRGVLGLRSSGQPPEPIYEAMSAARQEIARLGLGGLQTWGAYQHYGDPFFRFFIDPEEESSSAANSAATSRNGQHHARKPVAKTALKTFPARGAQQSKRKR